MPCQNRRLPWNGFFAFQHALQFSLIATMEQRRAYREVEKNLHARIPTALLVEAEKTAAAQRVSMDELSWRETYAFGERQSRQFGIKEEDVDRLIHERRPARSW